MSLKIVTIYYIYTCKHVNSTPSNIYNIYIQKNGKVWNLKTPRPRGLYSNCRATRRSHERSFHHDRSMATGTVESGLGACGRRHGWIHPETGPARDGAVSRGAGLSLRARKVSWCGVQDAARHAEVEVTEDALTIIDPSWKSLGLSLPEPHLTCHPHHPLPFKRPQKSHPSTPLPPDRRIRRRIHRAQGLGGGTSGNWSPGNRGESDLRKPASTGRVCPRRRAAADAVEEEEDTECVPHTSRV